jgi:hypothetical protein
MLVAALDLGLLIIVGLCFSQLLCGNASNSGTSLPTDPRQD